MSFFYLFLSGLSYSLAFAPYDYKFLIIVSFITLFYVLDGISTKKNRLLYLFLFSIIFHLFGISWISHSLTTFGSMAYISSFAVTLIVIIIVSLPYALVGLFYKKIYKYNFINLMFIAAIFIVAEYIKSFIFGGFPWLLVGYSQNESIFNFIYPIFGNYAVGYLIILFSGIIYKAIRSKSISYLTMSFFFFFIYFFAQPANLNEDNINQSNSIAITIYQPNIYPNEAYEKINHSKIIAKYNQILQDNRSSNLVIFPETILPIVFDKKNSLFDKFQSLTSNSNALVTGLFTKDSKHYHNSMVLFSNSIDYYDKRKLVPFGEYTPWYDLLIGLSNVLEIPLSNLYHGKDNKKELSIGNLNILPMICFESAFPRLIDSRSENEIIINISNDSWFGKTLAPHQHLQINQIRALEFNRYILRATNTGISAVIDNKGRLIDHIENDTVGTINAQIPTAMSLSFYSQYGDIFILMLIFLSLMLRGFNRISDHYE